MVIKELRQWAIGQLKDANISDTPSLDVMVLMKHLLQTDEIGIVLSENQTADEEFVNRMKFLLKRRIKGEPIAYLCGEKEFMSHHFVVNPGVLIPREDTECIVECAISLLTKQKPTILDIGTGSGCIAISLAKHFRDANVFAVDISEQALRCARTNAIENNVGISFRKMDILTEEPDGFYDLIISNPPYIPSKVISELDKNVRDFEPFSALDGGEEGLDFYKRIIPVAVKHLKKDGILMFEIGYHQGNDVMSLIKQNKSFISPTLLHDLAGRDRGIYTIKR